MSNQNKKKTVNYRRCIADAPADITPSSQFNLQKLLDESKEVVQKPLMRPIGLDGSRTQFLAYLVSKQGCTCGTLVLCEKNKLIPLVDAENDGSTWQGTIEPKDENGKKRRLQEQALFFAVRENHIAVIQTKELAIKDLQDFVVWLIQSKANKAEGWLFVLQNLPSQKAFNKLKDHKIKEIKIGKNAFSMVKTELPEEKGEAEGKRKRYSKAIHSDPMIMSWLKKLTDDDTLLEDLKNSDDPGSIYVELQISYRSRSEKDAQKVMQAIAATIGDQPELSPEIKLDGKSKIKGEELTIVGSVDVQCPSGNISADDAMARLADWLNESIKSGKVLVQ